MQARNLSARSPLARWLLLLFLALANPAVEDLLTDLTTLATGQDCCADDCDETGAPCTQQCAHCPCSGLRSIPVQASSAQVAARSREVALNDGLAAPSGATIEPPFRPPVS